MPKRAPHPCSVRGCPDLVHDGGRYCLQHAPLVWREHDRGRPSSAVRGYGYRWRKLRRMVLARDPLCADPFGEHGNIKVPATEVDHIVPLSQGGGASPDNLQALCKSCHSRKTAAEDGGWGRGIEKLRAFRA